MKVPVSKIVTSDFNSIGSEVDKIDVRISHRVIQLFSEGLYSSPNKAVEELVSNSFDAGANHVHVVMSPDLKATDATIVVVDDGEGMDIAGLKNHWIIGRSFRRENDATSVSGRRPIGKFGIGKLATYVLAEKLTHISKTNGKIYAATMNYGDLGPRTQIDKPSGGDGIFNDDHITIPARELTEDQAKAALKKWTSGSGEGFSALKLFGPGASDSWTVSIMSSLTELGTKVSRGRLKWILRSAMPLLDDFKLYLDGELLVPSKVDLPLIDRWVIGKDIVQDTFNDPSPKELEVTIDEAVPEGAVNYYGLSHPRLGRITGFIEMYQDDLSGGKSDMIERSNGFFVYVRGRLINLDDPGFGIERNLLRHGTFSRLRMVVHVDGLDEALRSSRESLQQGELYNLTRNFLHAAFNFARNQLVQFEQAQSPSAVIASRLSSAPGSLTRTPLISLARLIIQKKAVPSYVSLPAGLTEAEGEVLIADLERMAERHEEIVLNVELVPLDSSDGVAVYDLKTRVLQINTSHPFVASFQEQFSRGGSRLPLEMYAIAEVFTEAHLYHMNMDEASIRDILSKRDDLLRQFVRSSARRTTGMIALALLDAKDDANRLEQEMRAAFEAIGFDNVIRIGGKGKPDGTAEAPLPATETKEAPGVLQIQRYKVGLEAKSGLPVSAARLNTGAIRRHMQDYECDHHIVIGNGFATSSGEDSASVREIQEHVKDTGKTVTLMHIDDLARLVRLIPTNRVGLVRLRELFKSCVTPEQSKKWVDDVSAEQPEPGYHLEILETIWERGGSRPNEAIEYSSVSTALEYRTPKVKLPTASVIEYCKAMAVIVPGAVFARERTVEINRRPDLILHDIQMAIPDVVKDFKPPAG
jgi:hypothetical protein